MADDSPDPNWCSRRNPDIPAGDPVPLLLGRFLANWTASIEAAGLPEGGRGLRRPDLGIAAVDLGRPCFGGNVATVLSPIDPGSMERSMAALNDHYGFMRTDQPGKSGTVFLFSPWDAPDLGPFGWTRMGQEPLMMRPVPASGADAPFVTPPGLRIEPVQDTLGLRAFERTILRGFGSDDLEGLGSRVVFGPSVLADPRYRLWVGWEGERPVSAAAAFVHGGITDVTLVGTVPDARRRGYGAALTLRASLADPALPAFLLATDEGCPVYERIGYRSITRFTLWLRERAAPLG